MNRNYASTTSTVRSAKEEIRSILDLAFPIFITQLGWSVPSFLLASYIGRRFGSLYLDGYMLANLTGNLCTLSLIEGVLNALNTFLAHAYGSQNYPQLQVVSIRGFVVCMMILVPIMTVLAIYLDEVLLSVGEDAVASKLATQYYRIYAFWVPFYALCQITIAFLSVQSIMFPQVAIVLPSALILFPCLLYYFGSRIGFLGTCIANVLYQAIQVVALLIYAGWKKPFHPETWPTLQLSTITKAMDSNRFSNFMLLAAGGMLANSEWIFWEVLSLMIGTIGVVPLSVHTIPTQVLMVIFVIALSLGMAITIRIGNELPQSAKRAKDLCLYGFAASAILFAIIACCTYFCRHFIYSIFTTEIEVIEGCEEIWTKVVAYSFTMCIFVINMGIASGLGEQWMLGKLTFFFLWILALPSAFYFAIIKGGGLNAAWVCVIPPYMVLNVILIIYFSILDWEEISIKARTRDVMVDDELMMLSVTVNDYNNFNYGSTHYENIHGYPAINSFEILN